MTKPTIPALGTLPLPLAWAQFFADFFDYVEALEARIKTLEN